jgi:hypothetical protein
MSKRLDYNQIAPAGVKGRRCLRPAIVHRELAHDQPMSIPVSNSKAAEPIFHARRIFRIVENVERSCDVCTRE